jgi:hypothetical protein
LARRHFGEDICLLIERVAGGFEARVVGVFRTNESRRPSARASKRQDALEGLLLTLGEASREA